MEVIVPLIVVVGIAVFLIGTIISNFQEEKNRKQVILGASQYETIHGWEFHDRSSSIREMTTHRSSWDKDRDDDSCHSVWYDQYEKVYLRITGNFYGALNVEGFPTPKAAMEFADNLWSSTLSHSQSRNANDLVTEITSHIRRSDSDVIRRLTVQSG